MKDGAEYIGICIRKGRFYHKDEDVRVVCVSLHAPRQDRRYKFIRIIIMREGERQTVRQFGIGQQHNINQHGMGGQLALIWFFKSYQKNKKAKKNLYSFKKT